MLGLQALPQQPAPDMLGSPSSDAMLTLRAVPDTGGGLQRLNLGPVQLYVPQTQVLQDGDETGSEKKEEERHQSWADKQREPAVALKDDAATVAATELATALSSLARTPISGHDNGSDRDAKGRALNEELFHDAEDFGQNAILREHAVRDGTLKSDAVRAENQRLQSYVSRVHNENMRITGQHHAARVENERMLAEIRSLRAKCAASQAREEKLCSALKSEKELLPKDAIHVENERLLAENSRLLAEIHSLEVQLAFTKVILGDSTFV